MTDKPYCGRCNAEILILANQSVGEAVAAHAELCVRLIKWPIRFAGDPKDYSIATDGK